MVIGDDPQRVNSSSSRRAGLRGEDRSPVGTRKRPDVAQAGRRGNRRDRDHFAANRPRPTFLNRALLPCVLISRVMAA